MVETWEGGKSRSESNLVTVSEKKSDERGGRGGGER